jgi:glutaminase
MTADRDQTGEYFQAIAERIALRMKGETRRGKVADYIPELSGVSLDHFGIAIVPIKTGRAAVAGDADVRFSIQSVSKVFALTLALEKVGASLWKRVGREPSGNPFNSIVQLEHERGIPRNPFINPGAIVMADVILDGRDPDAAIGDILGLCRRLADDDSIVVDQDVAASETRTGSRNRALAYFMAAEKNIRGDVEAVLKTYFHQCSIAMSCRQLAIAGHYLAAAGYPDGRTDRTVTAERARRINSLMVTCGLYDASGEFAFRIGIPAKSGVGGGILGIVPGIASVVAWCPGLDGRGNSLLAQKALEELVRATGWSVFGPL